MISKPQPRKGSRLETLMEPSVWEMAPPDGCRESHRQKLGWRATPRYQDRDGLGQSQEEKVTSPTWPACLPVDESQAATLLGNTQQVKMRPQSQPV